MLGAGTDLTEVLRHLGDHRVDLASVAARLCGYERQRREEASRSWRAENARLKKLLAEAELDKAMLKELAEGKW